MLLKQNLIYIILTIVVLIIIQDHYYSFNKNINFKYHATDESYCDHYSEINQLNYLVFPKMVFAKPIYVTIYPGESLFIPKNWWYWIKTTEPSLAVNFWYEKSVRDIENPAKIYNQSKDWKLNKNMSYNFNNEDQLNNLYNIPKFVKQYAISKVYSNILISESAKNTGLHYDNFNGLLCLVKGRKDIILFSKKDTPFLYPYDCQPSFIKQNEASLFRYNKYKFEKDLKKSFSSPFFLYKIFDCLDIWYNCKQFIYEIRNNISYPLVWGCNWDKKKICFEYNDYIWNSKNDQLPKDLSIVPKKFKPYLKNIKNIIRVSINSYNQEDKVNIEEIKDMIIYTSENKTSPVFGETKLVSSKGDTIINSHKSFFFYSDYQDTILNFQIYLKKIKYTDNQIDKIPLKLLKKYKCSEICIHKKLYKKKLVFLIQYIGISLQDFIDFLYEGDYPKKLIYYVKLNKKKLLKLNYEITIIYDLDNMKILETGFFGII
ncbi:Cupin-like domain [seawater metagenome]|uniref:Cupin-like domain n=1 Tax=seawater metagenome TaxID=1561972 RepID=A0A5E8CJC4_9ZZZZ